MRRTWPKSKRHKLAVELKAGAHVRVQCDHFHCCVEGTKRGNVKCSLLNLNWILEEGILGADEREYTLVLTMHYAGLFLCPGRRSSGCTMEYTP